MVNVAQCAHHWQRLDTENCHRAMQHIKPMVLAGLEVPVCAVLALPLANSHSSTCKLPSPKHVVTSAPTGCPADPQGPSDPPRLSAPVYTSCTSFACPYLLHYLLPTVLQATLPAPCPHGSGRATHLAIDYELLPIVREGRQLVDPEGARWRRDHAHLQAAVRWSGPGLTCILHGSERADALRLLSGSQGPAEP